MGREAELIVVADTVVKADEKGEAFVQPWCVDNVLQKMDQVLSSIDFEFSMDGAWEIERARANGRRAW